MEPLTLLEVNALRHGVELCERFGDPAGLVIAPAEAALLDPGAGAQRRLHFRNGRWCAHQALGRLGRDVPLLSPRSTGPAWARRAIEWPAGVLGSVTHCTGYQAGAAAPRERLSALGIDAEPNRPLPPDVRTAVLTSQELAIVAHRAALSSPVAWDRVLFSAKEALFKAWSFLSDDWLDFQQCAILPGRNRRLHVRFLDPQVRAHWLDNAALPAVAWASASGPGGIDLVGTLVTAAHPHSRRV